MIKRVFQGISIFSILLGTSIIINTPTNLIGAVIGTEKIPISLSLIFAIFFIVCGIILLFIEKRR